MAFPFRSSRVPHILFLFLVLLSSAMAQVSYSDGEPTPAPDSFVRVRRPIIIWPVYCDNGMKVELVTMTVNGARVNAEYNLARRAVVYRPVDPLQPDPYSVRCQVRINGSRLVDKEWNFTVHDNATDPVPQPDAVQVAMWQEANRLRQSAGLPPFRLNANLCAAALAHTNYMKLNNVVGHLEKPGLAGYTGEDVLRRELAFGFDGTECFEDVHSGSGTPQEAVRALYNAPYHRMLFLRPGELEFGAGATDRFFAVSTGASKVEGIVFSPGDNSRDIPLSWDGIETPNPLFAHPGAKAPTGYVITLFSFGPNPAPIRVTAAKLQEAQPRAVTVNAPAFVVEQSVLRPGEIRLPAEFLRILAEHPETVSEYLWSVMSPDWQARATRPDLPDASAAALLVEALNPVITGQVIYTDDRFREVPLGDETKKLLIDSTGAKSGRLNRLLLEDAFPDYLRQPQGGLPDTGPPLPTVLSAGQLIDPDGLFSALRAGETPAARHIWSQFSRNTRLALARLAGTNNSVAVPLTEALNTLIVGPNLYDATAYADVPLRQITQSLLTARTTGNAAALNRLLLEDAFPGHLSAGPPEEEKPGVEVACWLNHANNDSELKPKADNGFWVPGAFLIPKVPLKPDTTYFVTVSAHLQNGPDGGTDISRKWKFRTGRDAAPVVVKTDAPKPVVVVEPPSFSFSRKVHVLPKREWYLTVENPPVNPAWPMRVLVTGEADAVFVDQEITAQPGQKTEMKMEFNSQTQPRLEVFSMKSGDDPKTPIYQF